MKKALLTTILLIGCSISTNAQQLKMGYTNVDYILAYMPETKTFQVELTEYEQQLSSQIQSRYQTLQQKIAEYEQGASMMIEAVRQDKEQEIQQLQAGIQQFQAQAEGLLQQKQAELLQPVYSKIQQAIEDVANEEGYTVIFRSESLLFVDESTLVEVSDLVFAKLGVAPPTIE